MGLCVFNFPCTFQFSLLTLCHRNQMKKNLFQSNLYINCYFVHRMMRVDPASHRIKVYNRMVMKCKLFCINFKCIFWNYQTLCLLKEFYSSEALKMSKPWHFLFFPQQHNVWILDRAYNTVSVGVISKTPCYLML